jgi:NADP-dependent 3-hydroxy acid dehydrogenase YdfG
VKEMDDRVVFLTGAAEGLGREVARELAKAGKHLALFDVQAEKLQAVTDELASVTTVLPLAVDLADADATEQAAARALEHAFAFLASIDADFATGQRFNAFQLSEAMRSVVA